MIATSPIKSDTRNKEVGLKGVDKKIHERREDYD